MSVTNAEYLRIESSKPKASLYIDDRGYRFEGESSFDDLKNLLDDTENAQKNLEPWNK